MKHKIKQFFNKLKTITTRFFLKLRKWFVCSCKFFDDTAHNRADSIFNLIAVYILVALNIVYSTLSGESNFNVLWLQIVLEIVYAIFVLFFIACTILYHQKSIWCWISNILFIAHYITLIDLDAIWIKQFTLFYLGLIFIFFCSWASWASAKDINKKGGIVDTILLAIGLTLSILGIILKEGSYEYYKYFIVSGIGIVYLYAIARAILQTFFLQNQIKINLFKTVVYIAVYIALIVGMPFLLKYAGVQEQVLKDTIIPLYASAIGGVLTLSGVAWTIKHTEKQRKREEQLRIRPYIVFDEPQVADKYYELPLLNHKPKTVRTIFPELTFFITDNADCNFIGLIIQGTFIPAIYELFMQKNSKYIVDKLQFEELIKTDKLYVVISDLLDNYYKYKCILKISSQDQAQTTLEYESAGFSAPLELTEEDLQAIEITKEKYHCE